MTLAEATKALRAALEKHETITDIEQRLEHDSEITQLVLDVNEAAGDATMDQATFALIQQASDVLRKDRVAAEEHQVKAKAQAAAESGKEKPPKN